MRRLSLVAASGGYSSLQCAGFSLWWLLLLRSTGSKHTGSAVVAHGLSCSTACGIFLDQGANPCPLHWSRFSTTAPPGKPKVKVSILRNFPVIRKNIFGHREGFMHILITVFMTLILEVLFIKVIHERWSLYLW